MMFIIHYNHSYSFIFNIYAKSLSTYYRRHTWRIGININVFIIQVWPPIQKYNRLIRCLLLVKSFVICFYLGWSGSVLQIRTNIIKVCSKFLQFEINLWGHRFSQNSNKNFVGILGETMTSLKWFDLYWPLGNWELTNHRHSGRKKRQPMNFLFFWNPYKCS